MANTVSEIGHGETSAASATTGVSPAPPKHGYASLDVASGMCLCGFLSRSRRGLASHLYKARRPERVKGHRFRQWARYGGQYRARQRARNREIKVRVLTHYGRGTLACACCGELELDFLTIEHKDRNGTADRLAVMGRKVGGHAYYRALIKLGLPDKNLEVLCHNCQWGRKISGTCPHQSRGFRLSSPSATPTSSYPSPVDSMKSSYNSVVPPGAPETSG